MSARGEALRGLIAGVLLVLALGWVRAFVEARQAMARADALAPAGHEEAANRARATALRWAAPFNAPAERALRELVASAEAQVRAGQPQAALATCRVTRGALLAAAGLLPLRGDRVAGIDARIAALSGRASGMGTVEGSRGGRLAARPAGAALAAVGFVSWVTAVFAWAARPGDSGASHSLRLGLAGLSALGLVCWALGLWIA